MQNIIKKSSKKSIGLSHLDSILVGLFSLQPPVSLETHQGEVGPHLGVVVVEDVGL